MSIGRMCSSRSPDPSRLRRGSYVVLLPARPCGHRRTSKYAIGSEAGVLGNLKASGQHRRQRVGEVAAEWRLRRC